MRKTITTFDTAENYGLSEVSLGNWMRDRKIGAFGGSNWTHKRLEEANTYAKAHDLVPFTVSSPNYGLADQIGDPFGGGAGCVSIAGPGNKEARDWYLKNDISVFANPLIVNGYFKKIFEYEKWVHLIKLHSFVFLRATRNRNLWISF